MAKEWDLFKTNFKPQGSGFLNSNTEKLFFLTLVDCKNGANYITKYCLAVNKLQSFSRKPEVDNNILIFFFQYNLSIEHSNYYQNYAKEHKLSNVDGKAQFILHSTIHHFQNMVKNPTSKFLIHPASVVLASRVFSPSLIIKRSVKQSIAQTGVQIGISHL